MSKIIKYTTKIGTFSIEKSLDGRYHPMFNQDELGSYISIFLAVDALVNNCTLPVYHPKTSEVLDTSKLSIPEDPTKWET